ncbi:hypothetical protein Tco_0629316 [Tanacetum coccineum]|uniref:Uncharacterized protein n=1 Tax=Tanacetum coccineum TaxID=301880 RepID=A0ABQ4WSU9_9ASTR
MIEHKPCFGLEIVNDGFGSETMRTSMILWFRRLFKLKALIKGSKNAWRREWCTEKGCLGRGGDRVERGRQLNMSNGGRRNEMDWVGCEKEEWVKWVNFVEVFVVGLERWIEEMDLSILVVNGGIVRASVVSIVTMGLSCDGCGEVSFEVMEEALEQSFGLLEFQGFSSFNWRELVHVGNGIKSVVVNGITTWVGTSSLIWRHHELMMDPREEEDRDWDEDHNFFGEMR